MPAQIYLITPPDADETFATTLKSVLEANEVAALLIQRGEREDDDYIRIAKKLIPIAQENGAAALLDNMPEAVKKLAADGVHMTGNVKDIKAAVKNLKPQAIVGVGGVHSKHDAMTKGELDVDYVFFGALGSADADADMTIAEMANWWAETFNVPAVCFDESEIASNPNYEFIALRDKIWMDADPKSALRDLSEKAS